MSDNTRYPAILFISKVIRFVAWCSLVFTVLGMIFVLVAGIRDGMTAILAFIGVGIFGGFLTLGLFALAESLIVLIDIEYNTRKSSQSIVKIQEIELDKRKENKSKEVSENLNIGSKIIKTTGAIKSVAEAIKKIKESGIELEIVEAGNTDNKYLLKKGTTIRYIYKDQELIAYAEELKL
jgi:hypothetical protein